MGCQSIVGYFPQLLSGTPGWREAIMVKCLAQGHKHHRSWWGFKPKFFTTISRMTSVQFLMKKNPVSKYWSLTCMYMYLAQNLFMMWYSTHFTCTWYIWSLVQYQSLSCLSSLGRYTALCCRTQCYSGYQTQYPSVPLVTGPISILKLSQLPGEYTALCCRTQCYSGYQTQYPSVPLVTGPISILKLSQLPGE